MKTFARRCGSAVVLLTCTLVPNVAAACPSCSVENVQRCHLAELVRLYESGFRKKPGLVSPKEIHLVEPARLPFLLDWYRSELRRTYV